MTLVSAKQRFDNTLTFFRYAALVLAMMIAGSSSAEAVLTSADVLTPGPYGVGFMEVEVYDAARDRTLPLLILYPAGPGSSSYPSNGARDIPADSSAGPRPLLVYSHGFRSFSDEGVYLTAHMATHGYVSMAPLYPLSNFNAPGGGDIADLVNQPGDVSFVLDKALEWNEEKGHALRRVIDPQRIGVLGLSFGAATSLLVTYHPWWFDDRIKAVSAAAAPITDYFDADFYDTVDVPALFNVSSQDAIVDFLSNGVKPLSTAKAPFFFSNVPTASHAGWSNIAAAIFEELDNPDTVGCAALGLPDPPPTESDDFWAIIGGAELGFEHSLGRFPCSWGDQLLTSMRPSRQHDLRILTVKPFFDHYIGDGTLTERLESLDYLNSILVSENAGEIEMTSHWSCSGELGHCAQDACPATSASGCEAAAKAIFAVQDRDADGASAKDRLSFKWSKGVNALSLAELSDPTTSSDHALCVYEGATGGLALEVLVPAAANGGLWSKISTKGYKYKDRDKTFNGVDKVQIKSGAAGRSAFKLSARGAGLPLAGNTLPLDVSAGLTVQWVNLETGNCLEAQMPVESIRVVDSPGVLQSIKGSQ
jgi:dienelactone hydrolase